VSRNTAKFTPSPGVPVLDRFGPLTIDIKKPAAVCNPADVNSGQPDAEDHPEHGLSYQVKVTKDTPKFLKVINQEVHNPIFGTTFVDVKRPFRVFVPSALDLTMSPSPLVAPNTDHFLCYKIGKSRGAAKFVPVSGVTIVDEFEGLASHLTVTVVKPALLCVPVNINGAQPGAHMNEELQLCYKFKRPTGNKLVPVLGAYLNNEYGPLRLDVKKSEHLCIRSMIVPP
jgi:hypothetical protein